MSARRRFVLECGHAAAAMLLMSCRSERLMMPACDRDRPVIDPPAPARELRDIYIVDGYTGLQLGTKENPYSVRGAQEFDALLAFLVSQDDLALHCAGRFATRGVYRWGEFASRNLGRRWTVDGDAEISLDPNAIADIDGQPLYLLGGPARSVTGIATIGNHSLLADRFNAKRLSLRTGSVLLDAGGAIDRQVARNFGSLGAETFVREIVGSGSITNSEFRDYDPASSDDQVTVNRVMGEEALHEGNRTFASGDNQVQAHTIYLASRGMIRGNQSSGARIGYYGDYYSTKGIEISDNDFDGCEHGVQLKLSPAGADFSHQDYTIGPNRIRSSGANVSLDTCGAPTSTRFIRGITIAEGLSVESFGAEWSREICRRAA